MHPAFPIEYIEPVFRPPSEAQSLILPVTNGCSWNKCTFCEMYTAPQKKFSVRDEQQVLNEIQKVAQQMIVQRVFLADGDALALSTRRLLTILKAIQEHLPTVNRVTSYCLPSNLKNKSVSELQELADAGLRMVCVLLHNSRFVIPAIGANCCIRMCHTELLYIAIVVTTRLVNGGVAHGHSTCSAKG